MPIPLHFPTERCQWWQDARFGMFIHWGLYSVLGRGEWAMSREAIPWEEYRPLADRFTAARFDPAEWCRVAKAADMHYMVLTTKHHEGFSLWDSPANPFNSMRSAARRDLVGEYVEAVRSAGLKVGLYYSLGDWHHPDWAAAWQGDLAARRRFVDYTHTLVHELLSRYGHIDILWYDLPQCFTPDEWRMVELNWMARSLQPHLLINNRGYTTEDFATPEQHASASAKGRRWESCMTLNGHWGFCPTDRAWKSPAAVAGTLANCASGGGNLLLNVGPDAEGVIPAESVRILEQVGAWLRRHDEAVRGTDRHDLMWYLFGPVSVRGNSMYCFLGQYYGDRLVVGGLTRRVLGATCVSTGRKLYVEQRGRQTIITGLGDTPPDPVLPVVRLDLDGPPAHDVSSVLGGADIFPTLPA